MGLFKIKGSSRAPFSAHRRLSNIAEESSEIDILEGSDNRESSSKRTPNKNKITPIRRKHRFQRLVEWDYGDAKESEQEYYEPPQDFLHVQKEHGDDFFQNGSEKRTDASKVNEKGRGSKNQNHGSGTLKIFQFAADTASLSKSCSSDSSVCSTSVTSKGAFADGFEDMKVVNSKPEAFPQFDSMKTSSLTAASSSSQSREESTENFPVVKRIDNKMNNSGTKIPKLNAPRASGRSLFATRGASPLVKAKKAVVLGSNEKFERSEDFTAFPQTKQAGNQDGFDGIDWPTGYTTHNEGGAMNTSKQEWRATSDDGFDNYDDGSSDRETVDSEPLPTGQHRMKRHNVGQEHDESSTFVEARRLYERTEAFINNTETLLHETGNNIEPRARRNIREQVFAREVEETESIFKENENSGFSNSNNIFRSKKVQFEKKLASPLTKIPSNDAEKHGRPVSISTNRVAKNGNSPQRKVPQMQAKREYFTPQRHKEPRSNVSFRFETENEGPRGYNSEPRRRVKPSNYADSFGQQDTSKDSLPLKRALATSTLGATPMESPDSMHLAVGGTGIDKKGSFASTIDSSDSQSTATSVSTFVEHSPRGIRGSFPTQMVQASSSLSSSSVSTNILNEVDFFKKPSAAVGGALRRPPTGVPPTSIFGSMLFQAGEQEMPAAASVSRSISPKRETIRGVPHDIHANDDTTVSDVTGSTAASEWMIQGNKLLSRYYYNNNDGARDGASQKKQKVSRRFRQQEQRTNVEDYQNIMEVVGGKRSQQPQKRRFTGYVSEYNERNDPLDKMKRHQHQFQYPIQTTASSTSRSVRSGFDNQNDDDASSLFEA